MQEIEYAIPGGSLYCEVTKGKDGEETLCVTRLQGLAGEVVIPEQIEGLSVTQIGKKAFLSKKNLRKLNVPAGVTQIGDWAFAYCDALERVALPDRDILFGKSVFMECGGLRYLSVQGKDDGVAALLAAAVTTAQAPYLLDVRAAGSGEWLEKWDARMLSVLHSADNEGYSKQVLCGEEDYGSTDLNAYESERRKTKVRLLLLRLLYPQNLSKARKQEMEEYLRAHTKGCPKEETWRVVLEEHGEDRLYYQLFAQLGCVSGQNLEQMLADIGGDHPEMKAYLMRYKEESIGYTDFFAGLAL